jgi:hypothetical protein
MLVFSDSGSLREDGTESSFLTKDKVIRVLGLRCTNRHKVLTASWLHQEENKYTESKLESCYRGNKKKLYRRELDNPTSPETHALWINVYLCP